MCQHALCEKKLLQHAMLQNPQAEFCNMAPGVLQHGFGVLQHGSVGNFEGPEGHVAKPPKGFATWHGAAIIFAKAQPGTLKSPLKYAFWHIIMVAF